MVECQTYTQASPPRREDACPRLLPPAHARPQPGEGEPAPHVDHAAPPPWKPRRPRERKQSFPPFQLVSQQPGNDLRGKDSTQNKRRSTQKLSSTRIKLTIHSR